METGEVKATKSPKFAVYVRVSTTQKDKTTGKISQTTELQRREILDYLASKGLTDYEIYEDLGYSGTKDSRPALKRLMADCRAGRINTVICWKLDRLFRSLRHLINTIEEFKTLKIQFIAFKDSIDLSTHSGRLMMQLLGAFAEFESSVIRERVIAGLENAKAKGKKLGRKYKNISLDAVLALKASGHTHDQIGKALGVSSKKIQRVLKVSKNEKGV